MVSEENKRNRRDFLKLSGISSLFLITQSCGELSLFFDTNIKTSHKQHSPNQGFTQALRDYIYATYDVMLKDQKEIPEEMQKNLEAQLQQQNLPFSIIQDINKSKDIPLISEYFQNFGLVFKQFNYYLKGYQLVRFSPLKTQCRKVFGREQAATICRVIEEQILPFANYAALKGKGVTAFPGGFNPKTKIIDYYPSIINVLANKVYDGIRINAQTLEKQLKDAQFLDQFVEVPSYGSIIVTPDFMQHLGEQLRYLAHKDLFNRENQETAALSNLVRRYEELAFVHETMHAADEAGVEVSFLDDHESNIRKELYQEYWIHAECRGYLAGINAFGLGGLAEVVKLLSGKQWSPNEPHTVCAQLILNNIITAIKTEQKKYQSFDFSVPQAYAILKQFTKLSDEETRDLAKKVFDKIYRGKSLTQYMKDLAGD